MANFQITVTRRDNGDVELIDTVDGAPAMEDRVTEIHREFPTHIFETTVETVRR